MSAGCVRWALGRTLRAVCGGRSACWTPASRLTARAERPDDAASCRRWSPFCTAADGAGQQAPPPAAKKKKQDPRTRATISTVGRKIPHPHIRVIGEAGENLGVMHRAEVIRIMDEKGLKLVLLAEHQDPPVYRLMSGKQVHDDRMKQWEKQKAKAGPVQVKELTFMSGIAAHDLSTKLKQVESWLEKKHHVRITLQLPRREPAADNLDSTLEQMVQQMKATVGFVTKPQLIRDGRAALCVLRPPSAKELLSQKQKENNDDDDSGPKAARSKTSAAADTDATDGSIQQ